MLGKRKCERDKSLFMSYGDLKSYVRDNGLKTKSDYIKHLKFKRERNGFIVPYNPSTFYKKNVWEGWSIFLRDEIYKKKYNGTYYTYRECKDAIVKYNFTSKSDFFNRISQIIKDDIRIPYSPSTVYKTEWEGWIDFLDSDNNYDYIENLVDFEIALKYARSLNFTMTTEWLKLKFRDLPSGMTKKPNLLYKDKGWVDWYHFLGIDKKTKMSYGELLISKFLDSKKIHYKYNKSLGDCISSSRLRFDFYIPKYNTCIEFDGMQHFQPIEYFGGQIEFEKTQKRDHIKNEWCSVNEIQLIRFNYKQTDEEIQYQLESLFVK
jgi:hypothetical protein